MTPVKVFISYSHDSEAHRQLVLALATRLRGDGVDAWIDRYIVAPSEGWPRWMQTQIEKSDFLLLICTATYARRFSGNEVEGVGKGATFEGLLAEQILYEAGARNGKIIALLPDREPEASIPLPLRPFTRYRVPSQYEDLYGQLTGQPEVTPPPLGQQRSRGTRSAGLVGPLDPRSNGARWIGLRILIIDDKAHGYDSLNTVCNGFGGAILVDRADGLAAGLELLSQHRYDLAVVDLMPFTEASSPQGVYERGLDLLAAVRARPLNRDCAVILLTSHLSTQGQTWAPQCTAFRFMFKAELDENALVMAARAAIIAARRERAQRAARRPQLSIAFDPEGHLVVALSNSETQTFYRATPESDTAWLSWANRASQLGPGVDSDTLDTWGREMHDIGRVLWQLITQDESILAALLAVDASSDPPTRPALRCEGPIAALCIPFELLRSETEYFAQRHEIARQLALPTSAAKFPESFAELMARLHKNEEPLRVVLAAGSKAGGEQELDQVADLFEEDLGQLGVAYEIKRLYGSRSVERALLEQRPHILHYSEPQSGLLRLPDQCGLRLVFLSHYPWTPDSAGWLLTFERLASKGIPIILGNRWPMSRPMAQLFASVFYRALWRTLSAGEATLEARRVCRDAVLSPNDLGWASPVLLLQGGATQSEWPVVPSASPQGSATLGDSQVKRPGNSMNQSEPGAANSQELRQAGLSGESGGIEDQGILVVGGEEVREALSGRESEVLAAVRRAYLAHATGQSSLPYSTFLRFPGDNLNRIIALPAYLGQGFDVAGLKWIASFPANIKQGLARASAVLILNSASTGLPEAILEGSLISSARTGASAAAAADALLAGDRPECIGLIGTGLINLEIARFLRVVLADTVQFLVYDLDADRAFGATMALRSLGAATGAEIEVHVAQNLEEVLRRCRLVSFATTAVRPYVDDLSICLPGTVILHISLRDLTPRAILAADNVVDDPDHVCRAQTSIHLAEQMTGSRAHIRCTLADILQGRAAPRADARGVAVFSAFGLGILDLAVAKTVRDFILSSGKSTVLRSFLPRTEL